MRRKSSRDDKIEETYLEIGCTQRNQFLKKSKNDKVGLVLGRTNTDLTDVGYFSYCDIRWDHVLRQAKRYNPLTAGLTLDSG